MPLMYTWYKKNTEHWILNTEHKIKISMTCSKLYVYNHRYAYAVHTTNLMYTWYKKKFIKSKYVFVLTHLYFCIQMNSST